MDPIEQLKTEFEPLLTSCDVHLYELKWTTEKKNRVLQVAITKSDGTMDLDTCAKVSEILSEYLDKKEELQDYYLEVCSPGAERSIQGIEELKTLVGAHIHVRVKKPLKSMMEFTGDVLSCEDTSFTMNYRDKALTKTITIDYGNIDSMNLAVKF